MTDVRSRAALAVAATMLALCLGATPALGAAGPTVFIRIEGDNGTLLPRTQVTTSTDPVPTDNCSGTSVAGAIEVATHGNWDRGANFTQTLLGETHAFNDNDYWAEWLNYKVGNGICSDELAPGDDIVMLVDRSYAPDYTPTAFPLNIVQAPGTVEAGQPFTVSVVEYRGTFSGTGDATPVAGATVAGGGASAQTDANGNATLSLPSSGNVTLQATRSGNVRSATVPVCVHAGQDGNCGSALQARDTRLPVPNIAGIRQGQRFSAGHGPRVLHGVIDPGGAGVFAVRLRIRRQVGGRCSYFSTKVDRFRRGRCDATYFLYTLGDRPSWSFLLPSRLPVGAYAVDLVVMDHWARVVRGSVRFSVR